MTVSSARRTLEQKLRTRTAHVGVVGLGYVGLPLAVELAESGFQTIGIDRDARKTSAIERGESYIPDVPTARLASLTRTQRLRATTDFSVVGNLDTVNICVPTPLRKTKDPDMSFIVSAVEQIATYLRPHTLVVLESTTYPGTTEELVQPLLEASGLKAGVDFFLAFSPERVDPGNPTFHTRNVPKVVGGVTPECARLAAALYEGAVDVVVPVSSTRVAEMVKLLENTFRAVNIGLVNELALMCDTMGIDVWEVIAAASTKPFGFMPFYPGPGLGGHCIPIDPFYLSWKARQSGFEARFIELAGHVNAHMPHFVVNKIVDALNTQHKAVNGARILVAGITYKRDIDDIRESPALDIMHLLDAKGASIDYSDPYVPLLPASSWPGGRELRHVEMNVAALRSYDCVVVVTDHRAFDYPQIVAAASLIVDSRNAIPTRASHIFRLGAPANSSATVGVPG